MKFQYDCVVYFGVDGFATVGALVVNLGVDASEQAVTSRRGHDTLRWHVAPVQTPDDLGSGDTHRRAVHDDRRTNVQRHRRHRWN